MLSLVGGAWLLWVVMFEAPTYRITSVKIMAGDNPAWAAPGLNDDAWPEIYGQRILHGYDHYWLRMVVDVTRGPDQVAGAELFFHAVGSYEIYWEGRLTARNGQPSPDPKTEVPGRIDGLFPIPGDLLKDGPQLVAIRLSRHHRSLPQPEGLFDFHLGLHRQTRTGHTGRALLPLIMLGGLLVVAGYFFFLFALEGRREHLLLGVLCCSVTGILVAETWRGLIGYTYPLHRTRLRFILFFALCTAWLLPAFTWRHLQRLGALPAPPRRAGLVAAGLLTAAAVIPSSYDMRSALLVLGGTAVAFGLSCFALRRSRTAGWSVAGTALCLSAFALGAGDFLNETFFYMFPIWLLLVLASLAVQAKEDRRAKDRALQASARLEADLLKKLIQPHFIMNTLTALSGWVHLDSAKADRFIDALAQEFRQFSALASAQRIPLEKELALCESHLAVLTFRMDFPFVLDAEGVDPMIVVPPGLIHTLLENAVSHNRYREGPVRFRLRTREEGAHINLCWWVPTGRNTGPSAVGQGTGTKYIETRLQELWPDNWQLSTDPADDGFRTTLSFPKETL